jgi:hypothetical protein
MSQRFSLLELFVFWAHTICSVLIISPYCDYVSDDKTDERDWQIFIDTTMNVLFYEDLFTDYDNVFGSTLQTYETFRPYYTV